MMPVAAMRAGAARVAVVAAGITLAGCEGIPLQSTATNVGSAAPLPATTAFRYAMVSPASSNDTEGWAEAELVRHSYTVFPGYAVSAVIRANPPPPILMIECYDLGTTLIVVGKTRKVRFIGVNMRTGERLYDGNGEAIGPTGVEDFQGAVKAALARLPRPNRPAGRMMTLGEVPNALVTAAREGVGGAGSGSAAPGGAMMSSGSGFVVTASGHVVTNAHVVDGCKTLSGRVGGVDYPLRVQATDANNDLALLVLPPGGYAIARLRQPGTPCLVNASR